jgi:hypothetical protein
VTKQLINLRYVPEDERKEICELLASNGIEFYETSAGNWGISLPAIWLVDEQEYQRARELLDIYSEERYRRARVQYEALKRAGKSRTFLDIASENPLRFLLYIAIVIVLAYFSIAPFIAVI